MRADRLLALILMLQTRGKMTTHALAEALGVSRRTILRDIDVLSAAGIPLYAEGGHGGGIALDENYRVSLTGLKEAEARSLFIGSSAKLLNDIGLGEAAESTLLKLFAALPKLHQHVVDQFRQRIHIDPLWWWHEAQPLPFWAALQQAVFEDRCIQVVYEHYNGDVVIRTLEPYGLIAKASLWYLLARRDDEFRTYRISRLHEVILLDSHFERQEDFDLAAYWQDHVQEFVATLVGYTFTLRINETHLNAARWNLPGRCQIIESPNEDGWLTADFQVESREVAKLFVLGLGRHAIIVAPAELREAVIGAACEILGVEVPLPQR